MNCLVLAIVELRRLMYMFIGSSIRRSAVPYVLLSAAYVKDAAGMEGHFFIIAVWSFATICLFHAPIFDFVGGFFEGSIAGHLHGINGCIFFG